MRDRLGRWADPPLHQVSSVAQQQLRVNYGWVGA